MRRAAVTRLSALLGAAAVALSGCAAPAYLGEAPFPAQDNAYPTPDYDTVTLPSGRSFIVHVPSSYSAARPLPVVLGVHGYRGTDQSMYRDTTLYTADAVTVFALGRDDAWAPAPYATTTVEEDLAYIDGILGWVRGHYATTGEAFAVGFSNGGSFVHVLSCYRAESFRAFATVSAANYDAVEDGCSGAPGRAYLDIHGTADGVIGYDGGVRHDTHYLSVNDVLDVTARRNGCNPFPRRRTTGAVTHEEWNACDVPTEHYRIAGGTHTWPGGATDTSGLVPAHWTTQTVLSFFGVGQVT